MAKIEKINFLSETIVNSAEGCARNIWIGTEGPPDNTMGNDGDIYIQYTEEEES